MRARVVWQTTNADPVFRDAAKVGGVFFFRDPLSSHPHESDIQALTRLCDVHDVLAATNPRTGDALVHALETNPSHIENMLISVTQSTSAVVDAYKTKQASALRRRHASRLVFCSVP